MLLLNKALEVLIFFELKLDKFKANNSWQSENKLFIFATNDESKWLKSIDIIFFAFLSILASKNFSKFVT